MSHPVAVVCVAPCAGSSLLDTRLFVEAQQRSVLLPVERDTDCCIASVWLVTTTTGGGAHGPVFYVRKRPQSVPSWTCPVSHLPLFRILAPRGQFRFVRTLPWSPTREPTPQPSTASSTSRRGSLWQAWRQHWLDSVLARRRS